MHFARTVAVPGTLDFPGLVMTWSRQTAISLTYQPQL